MINVLVASAFTGSIYDKEWCRLQSYFLNKTRGANIHKLGILSKPKIDKTIYNSYGYETHIQTIIDKRDNLHDKACVDIFNFFEKHENYEYLCLLDSDAWPVDPDWVSLCIKWINSKPNNQKHLGAAVVRVETLDLFPHPCAFFVGREFIEKRWKNGDKKLKGVNNTLNLRGDKYGDVFSNLSLQDFYPLLRTNKVNLHPWIAGIYANIFYHHCCGSRNFLKESKGNKLQHKDSRHLYYEHILDKIPYNFPITTVTDVFDELFKNPENFINKLKY